MFPAVVWLGLIGAFCTTFAFLPQVVKTWRTRHTADISLTMFLLMTAGEVFWLLYGIAIADPPLIIANVVSLGFAGTILFFKIKYG